jgi:predicted secreted hydrolase
MLPLSSTLQSTIAIPDLAEQPDAPVEWWFVQGAANDRKGRSLHFMAAFFQVHLPGNGQNAAHMLLIHIIMDDGTGSHVVSRITPGIANAHEIIAREVARANFANPLSMVFLRRHILDTRRFAEGGGIEIAAEPATVGRNPFSVEWGDFRLVQGKDSIRVSLPLGEPNDAAELTLIPKRRWLQEGGAQLDPSISPPYSYLCCPRLELTGTRLGEPLLGQAWMDRQWGHLDGWLFSRKPDGIRLLGWDWVGISLETGHDIMAMRQHLPDSSPHGRGFAIVFSDESPPRIQHGFTAEPLRHWTSSRTGTVYPVSQRHILQELGIELEISPLMDDQEIPVFGAPAIWQGAVTASGRMGNREVSGHGRLELFGYGYAETISRYVLRRIRKGLAV